MILLTFPKYIAFSAWISIIVLGHFVSLYKQFFPVVTHLISHKFGRIVVANDALILIILTGKFFKRLFFGSLTQAEEERVWELSYVNVIETCLALTIFREDLSSIVFLTFVLCFFLKIFHWVAPLRVQHIESLQQVNFLVFFRLYSLSFILLLIDSAFIYSYSIHFIEHGPSVKILFLTEYLIMATQCLSVIIRLTIHLINIRKENGLVNRDIYIFYLDTLTDLSQSAIYIAFFLVILTKYGIPVHLLRDIYLTVKSAYKRIMDFYNYRRNIVNMDERFPNATREELETADECIYCRSRMESAKKLPCGHMYHSHCIRTWLEDHHECPLCYAPVDQDAYRRYRIERGELPDQQQEQQPHQQQEQVQNLENQLQENLIQDMQADPMLLQYYQMWIASQQQQQDQQQESNGINEADGSAGRVEIPPMTNFEGNQSAFSGTAATSSSQSLLDPSLLMNNGSTSSQQISPEQAQEILRSTMNSHINNNPFYILYYLQSQQLQSQPDNLSLQQMNQVLKSSYLNYLLQSRDLIQETIDRLQQSNQEASQQQQTE